MDVELVLQLFNEEENPTVAHNILLSLVSFHLYTEHLDVESRQRVWNIGTYLLANSRTQTDKEAAVILLTVHMLSEKV